MTTTVLAPSAHDNRRVAVQRVTQRRVLRAEWVKLSTLRSTWITLITALVGTVLVGSVASWAVNRNWTHLHGDFAATFSAVTTSLSGVNVAQLAIVVLGALIVTGEYATGMIRSSLATAPRRLPVLWAKLAVFGGLTFVTTTIAAAVSFFAGQALLGTHGTDLAAPRAVSAIVGVGLYLTAVGALALGLGFVIRSTAGTIAAVFGLLLVAPGIAQLLPTTWQPHVLPYLPSQAGGALFNLHPDPGTLAPWTGFAVLCAWTAAAIAAGAFFLRRRDA